MKLRWIILGLVGAVILGAAAGTVNSRLSDLSAQLRDEKAAGILRDDAAEADIDTLSAQLTALGVEPAIDDPSGPVVVIERGERGEPGRDGVDGKDGTDGTDAVGVDGKDGQDGADGASVTGPQGPPGPAGETVVGPQGPAGESVVGPQGEQGFPGIPGSPPAGWSFTFDGVTWICNDPDADLLYTCEEVAA